MSRLSRFAWIALVSGVAAAGLAACGASPDSPKSTDWAPSVHQVAGLDLIAQSDSKGFRLHTASGTKTFLPGINLGSTLPLHQPGEVGTIPASDYRRWLGQMGALGVRVVRIYTLLSPGFYAELARYNVAHPTTPLYLMQGVYLPDESYIDTSETLYTKSVDEAFTQELLDVSKAVHGTLTRPAAPGRAGGTYDADVSKWLTGWIAGVEWDTPSVLRTDRRMAKAPYSPGKYFAATVDASATERWIARHLDSLAASEASYGDSSPIAFANWPTADPLTHPDEPLKQEDLNGVDANHVLPTAAWPGGTFASFHAYPYYPDFQRHQADLLNTTWKGEPDAYAGYLSELKQHFAPHMPLLITEFGVPGSLGSAHDGLLGRDQGDHTEQQQLATDADLMRMIAHLGLGGAFVFEWSDEWFKRTWNTAPHQVADRRQLWHDPLTNEQWFGVLATDSKQAADSGRELNDAGPIKYALVTADASYLRLQITPSGDLPARLGIEVDTVPGAQKSDYRFDFDLTAKTGQAFVRKALDPIRLDYRSPSYVPDAAAAWHPFRQIINRSLTLHGTPLPAEYYDVGKLIEGNFDPKATSYDSLATWWIDKRYKTIDLRLPWPMVGMADPSSLTALGEGSVPRMVRIKGLGLSFDLDGQAAGLDYTWPAWNNIDHTERLKAGAGVMEKAYRDLAP